MRTSTLRSRTLPTRRTGGVNGVRQDPLAGARLAGQQYGRRVLQCRDLARPLEHRPDGGRVADHGCKPDIPSRAAAVVLQLLLEEAVLPCPVGQELQLLQVHRLLDIVEGAE